MHRVHESVELAFHGLGVNWRVPVDVECGRLRKWLKPFAVEERTPLGRHLLAVDGRVTRYWTRWGARRAARSIKADLVGVYGKTATKFYGWKAVKR